MRRFLTVTCIALGVFLIVVAVLGRFYAYPKLAVAPIDQESVTQLQAEDATILDIATLGPITTDLTVESRTVGDVEASEEATEEAGKEIRVWVNTTSTRSEDGEVRSRASERAAFDAYTGEAVPCDDCFREDTQGEKEQIELEGLVYKFPFDTQKQDYDFWDNSINDTAPATYTGTDEVEGMSVYTFEMVVPDTVVGQREVPGSLFDSKKPAVDADVHYEITRTFFVEPNTGAVVNRIDAQNNYLEYDGTQVTATEATVSYTDEQVKAMVEDEVGNQGTLLGLLKGIGWILALGFGILLLAVGLVLMFRARSEDADHRA
jgi:Porin PorA